MNKTTRSGVYAIKNTINGKVYVGSAVTLKNRRHTHMAMLRQNKHHSRKLQNSWNKYGESAFVFEVLERVVDKELLVIREQYQIDLLDSVKRGYNICPAAGSPLGVKHTDETRRKVSLALTGRPCSAETKAKMSASRMGYKPTVEAVEKMAAALRGQKRPCSEKRRLAISKAKKGIRTREPGWKHTPEARANMSIAQKGWVRVGKPHDEQWCKNISKGLKGKMSEPSKRGWETRRARIAANG